MPTSQSLEATSSIMENKIQNSSGSSTQPCLVPLATSNDADTLLARYSHVLVNRLNDHVTQSDVIPESQRGFRAARVSMDLDMVFASRQIQEKCKEQHRDLLCMVFIDLSKAFNSVSRSSLSTTVCGAR